MIEEGDAEPFFQEPFEPLNHYLAQTCGWETVPELITLDVMHRAEEWLFNESLKRPTDILWRIYRVELENAAGPSLVFHANAEQRLHAFCRTIAIR